jgi:hypothetical protein
VTCFSQISPVIKGCAADSIIGVTYFSQISPVDFCTFDAAFVALFRITAGDAWIESLPAHTDDGVVNPGIVTFLITYVLLVNWTLLPIRCAARRSLGGVN